jgi:hypothetical protein
MKCLDCGHTDRPFFIAAFDRDDQFMMMANIVCQDDIVLAGAPSIFVGKVFRRVDSNVRVVGDRCFDRVHKPVEGVTFFGHGESPTNADSQSVSQLRAGARLLADWRPVDYHDLGRITAGMPPRVA